MDSKPEIIVGLDIGTTKIAVVVAQKGAHDTVDVVGIGTHPSKGLRKGVVINIEATVNSIRKAVEEAELMAGAEISSVYAGIAGEHIKGFNSHGIVAVRNQDEIGVKDVERVIDAAQAVAIPLDREILHILPQEYLVDQQDGIREPLGMSGVRLETKVHIVTGAISSAQNIVKSANRVGLKVNDIVLEPIASAEAVLSAEEKELGVALVDIGGGTTDITLFHSGAIKHTAVIALGGDNLTNDVAHGLRTPKASAEEIKRRYGSCLVSHIKSSETIEVPSTGGREPEILPRYVLAEILEPRMEEIFSLVQKEISKAGYDGLLAGGIVLSGGTVLLEGTAQLAEKVFRVPVRVGCPSSVGGLVDVVNSPAYATGVGLVLYGAKNAASEQAAVPEENVIARFKEQVSNWFARYF